jgi:hypothetical protein
MEIFAFLILFLIFILIPLSVLFKKAGKPFWSAFIPLYNIFVFLEVIGKPWWWFILLIVPFINIVWCVWAANLFAKRFGDGIGGTLAFIFVPYIYLPLLAIDKKVVYIKS